MRTGPGDAGSSTSDFVYVSKSRIDPPEGLVAWQRRDHGPELRPAVLPGQGAPHSPQGPADCLQLADELTGCVLAERAVRTLAQLAEARERLAVSLTK